MKVRFGFLCGSAGKESACNAGDWGSIPGLGRSPGEGKGHLLQYSGLEKSRDCIVLGGHKELDTTKQLSLSLSLKWSAQVAVQSWPGVPASGKYHIRSLPSCYSTSSPHAS